MHESLSVDHVREARRALLNYCLDERHRERYLRLLEPTSRLVAKARIQDLAWDEGYKGVDAPIFAVIRRLARLYSDLIAGVLVVVGDYILARIRSNVSIDGAEYEAGETAVLDVGTAARLVAAGLAEPVESNIIKLLARHRRGGG
ncbi:hypothetical protein JCM10135_08360 [Stetteria hydrogenophila]